MQTALIHCQQGNIFCKSHSTQAQLQITEFSTTTRSLKSFDACFTAPVINLPTEGQTVHSLDLVPRVLQTTYVDSPSVLRAVALCQLHTKRERDFEMVIPVSGTVLQASFSFFCLTTASYINRLYRRTRSGRGLF